MTDSNIRHLRLPALLLACLLLAGCMPSGPALEPLASDARILAFGDSLTYGTGTDPDNSYPAVLARLSGLQVINAGRPGEISAEGLERLEQLLGDELPDLLILCHGGNDLLRKLDVEATERHLSGMITLAHAHGVQVMLIGVPEPKLLFLKPAPLYTRLAQRFDLVYLPDTLPSLEGDTAMKSDPIHLNTRGYQALAEAIHQQLQIANALPAS